ncbi:MAG TPA: hypothetical protein DDY77_00780 [Clostridiales bacterium]|nr:hypothetical protein [Clostridiales bacterium]
MNKIQVAIVEDEVLQSEKLEKLLCKYALEKGVGFGVKSFADGEKLFENGIKNFDLLFLDIELSPKDSLISGADKKENGMKIAEKIRAEGLDTPIVFVTNLAQYAVDGYSVGALDFILKPVAYESLKIKMDRIIDKLFSLKDKTITLKTGTSIRSIVVADIKFIEVSGHRTTVHVKEENFDTYVPLSVIEREINDKKFVRCNVCYLVNLAFVTKVDGNVISVGDDEIIISRSKKREFVTALNKFLGGSL